MKTYTLSQLNAMKERGTLADFWWNGFYDLFIKWSDGRIEEISEVL